MSTVRQVWDGIADALGTLYPNPPFQIAPRIFIDLPPVRAAADLAKAETPPLISIFDWKHARNTTRWMPFTQRTTINPTGMSSSVSSKYLNAGGSEEITINGPVLPGDAISCVIHAANITVAAVAVQFNNETAATMATKLAAAINASPLLAPYVTAAPSGNVVTVNNIGQVGLILQSFTGNGGTRVIQVGTSERPIQISLFTRNEDDREAYGNLIFQWIGYRQAHYGITLEDGAQARIRYNNDYPCKETHQVDIFRWDFVIDVEHSITYQEQLYSVLALTPNFTVQT